MRASAGSGAVEQRVVVGLGLGLQRQCLVILVIVFVVEQLEQQQLVVVVLEQLERFVGQRERIRVRRIVRDDVIRFVLITSMLVMAGCGQSCPPDKPCTAPDGGTFFDCGQNQCHGTQLCVVPMVCPKSSYEDPGARCVELDESCSDFASRCECEAELENDGGSSEPPMQCCYFADWTGFTTHLCNAGCL